MMKHVSFKATLVAAALASLGIAALPLAAQAAEATPGAHPSAAAPAASSKMTPENSASTKGSSAMTREKSTLASSDKKFVEKASKANTAEIQLGKLASEKAESPEVKQFGERMVKDHTAAEDKLQKIAGEKGITPSTKMDASSQRLYEKLQKLSGAQFDRDYIEHMVSDHEKDVKEFKSEAKSAKDPQVKSFAQNTAPTLEEHLKMAKAAESAVKNEKSASSANSASGEKTASNERTSPKKAYK
jgi:putative membrane protein